MPFQSRLFRWELVTPQLLHGCINTDTLEDKGYVWDVVPEDLAKILDCLDSEDDE